MVRIRACIEPSSTEYFSCSKSIDCEDIHHSHLRQLPADSGFDPYVYLDTELVLGNRSLCFQDFCPAWQVRMSANLDELAKIPLACFWIPAELGSASCSIERSEPSWLFRQRSFELLERLLRLFQFQQHLTQQLTRRCQRTRCHRAFLSPIFQFRR